MKLYDLVVGNLIKVFNRIEKIRQRNNSIVSVLAFHFERKCIICGKFSHEKIGFVLGWPSEHDGEFVCGKCVARLVDEELDWQNRESGL